MARLTSGVDDLLVVGAILVLLIIDQTPEVNPDTKHMETQECMNVQTETETQPNNESGDGLAEEVVASNSFDNNRTAATLESPQVSPRLMVV